MYLACFKGILKINQDYEESEWNTWQWLVIISTIEALVITITISSNVIGASAASFYTNQSVQL